MDLAEVQEVAVEEKLGFKVVFLSLVEVIDGLKDVTSVFEGQRMESTNIKVGLGQFIEFCLIFFEKILAFVCEKVF